MTKIPVRVRSSHDPSELEKEESLSTEAEAPVAAEAASLPMEVGAKETAVMAMGVEERRKPVEKEARLEELAEEESLDVWRDRALRLQAEMENFRKRQRWLAGEQIAADRERLLRSFLGVADDLRRALDAPQGDRESLRQGVKLTYQSMMRLLDQEGVEPIQAVGEPFDPNLHEAVSTVPHYRVGVGAGTVVEVAQEGYRLGDRLLRPAQVVVAV